MGAGHSDELILFNSDVLMVEMPRIMYSCVEAVMVWNIGESTIQYPMSEKKHESLWLNLGFNILIPTILLKKGDVWFSATPSLGLIIALAFPIGYGVYDFTLRKKCNFLSILGFSSILITGCIGLLELSKDWIAVKEAAFPLILGIVTLCSLKTRKPLVKYLLLNENFIDVPRVEALLETTGKTVAFDRLLKRCTLWLVVSFVVSAVLNFTLARLLIKSPTGTMAFNEELGNFNLLNWPVIVLPFTVIMVLVLWKLVGGIRDYTGLKTNEIFGHASSNPSTT